MHPMPPIKNNASRPSSLLLWGLVWLAVALIGTYIRLYPLRAHIFSPTQEQATMLVVYGIKQNFLQQIHQQNPDLPKSTAERIADERLNKTLRDEPAKVRAMITKVNNQLFQDNHLKEKIYLLESDPYYYYQLTENIVRDGRIAETIKGSKYFNPLMGAPSGFWQPFTIHPYLGFVFYKICQIFNPAIPLMSAVAFLPILLSALAIVSFLWVCRLLGIGLWPAGVSALFFTLAPIYLKRSSLGWYDTDPYNLLFPLLLVGILLKSFQTNVLRHMYVLIIAFALTITAYALFWQGWGFMFMTSIACVAAVCFFNQFFYRRKDTGQHGILFLGGVLLASLVAISIAFGLNDCIALFAEGLDELRKFTVKGLELWPDLFIAVGELKKSSWPDTIDSLGLLLCLGGSAGFLNQLPTLWKKRDGRCPSNIIILSVLLAATVFITLGAQRFALFTLIPLSLFFALGLEALLGRVPLLVGRIILPLLAAFCFWSAQANIQTVLNPIFNSTWDEALTKIETDTPMDSIINTWWPPGHFIKAIAHRRVPFDGASLSESATGYWMANVLLSTDENHALGLLRMMNLSGNHAVTYLTQNGFEVSQAVMLLHAIAPRTPADATVFLKSFLKDQQIRELLTLTHAGHPHSYVLLYNELVDENLILTFTGRWNFKKVEDINADERLRQAVPKRGSPLFVDFLWQLSGGPSKYGEPLMLVEQNGSVLRFSENLTVDLNTMDASIDSKQYGKGQPLSIVYATEQSIVEHKFPNGRLNYSILLYKEDGQYTARLMDQNIANSLLIKLFYFDGKGLQHFKPFTSTRDMTGRTKIKVFEAVW